MTYQIKKNSNRGKKVFRGSRFIFAIIGLVDREEPGQTFPPFGAEVSKLRNWRPERLDALLEEAAKAFKKAS
jgi:hypothetical protein